MPNRPVNVKRRPRSEGEQRGKRRRRRQRSDDEAKERVLRRRRSCWATAGGEAAKIPRRSIRRLRESGVCRGSLGDSGDQWGGRPTGWFTTGDFTLQAANSLTKEWDANKKQKWQQKTGKRRPQKSNVFNCFRARTIWVDYRSGSEGPDKSKHCCTSEFLHLRKC